jgi:hypothetical protein
MRGKQLILSIAALLIGCGGPAETRPLEIGVRGADDSFVPLSENESVPVVLGANGLNMIVPSLRAMDIDPIGPDPTVEVSVGGILMAADIEGSRVDMVSDGAGYVLFDLRVPFQTDLCCYNCSPGRITAVMKDASGTRFEGAVTVQLERASCPDPGVCCQDANACPDPSLTKVCE